jgi:hypothetical protein
MAITTAFQAEDRGSTPRARSKLRCKIMSTRDRIRDASARRLILAKKGNVVMYETSTKYCIIYKDKQCAYQGNKLFGKHIFNTLVAKG